MPAPQNPTKPNPEIAKLFENWLTSKGVALTQRESTLSLIHDFLSWFNLLPFVDRRFTVANFEIFRDMLSRKSLDPQTFNQYIEALKSFGSFLIDEKLTAFNPTLSLHKLSNEEMVTPAPSESIFDQFSKYLINQDLSEVTIKNYAQDVEQFFAWFNQYEKGVELSIQSPKIIDSFRRYLQMQLSFAPASVERKISSLRKFFSWAVTEGYFASSPFNKNNTQTTIGDFVSPTNLKPIAQK